MKVSIVSVSRTAGSPQTGQVVFFQVGCSFSGRFTGGLPLHIVGQQDRQLIFRDRIPAMLLCNRPSGWARPSNAGGRSASRAVYR